MKDDYPADERLNEAFDNGMAIGRMDGANAIRETMRKILPPELLYAVEFNDAEGVYIEGTLKQIATLWKEQKRALEVANTVIKNLQDAITFYSGEIESVASGSYSHAQKNGVMKFIAGRLSNIASLRPTRRITPPDEIPF